MRTVCERPQEAEGLPRWPAQGHYHVATDVPSWTAHPDFPRPGPADHCTACIERLTDPADRLFRGRHAYLEPHTWSDLQRTRPPLPLG